MGSPIWGVARMGGTHRPCLTSSPQPPWRNHPQSPAGNSAGRCAVSCQARSRPRATGIRVAVPFAGWPASNGTIVANPRRRRDAVNVSFRSVSWHSSNPSQCWLRLGTGEPRPRIRSCLRRSRTLRPRSVAVRGRSDNCESHGLRGARFST